MAEHIQTNNILLDVKGLKKYFPIQKGLFRRVAGHVKAVDNVSFFVREGETLGLVGESGCGKTTASRSVIRLYEPTAGDIHFKTALFSSDAPDGRPARVGQSTNETSPAGNINDLSGSGRLAEP
jgi:ABC-type oligopeptide transport system ATPase subunit